MGAAPGSGHRLRPLKERASSRDLRRVGKDLRRRQMLPGSRRRVALLQQQQQREGHENRPIEN